MHLYLTKKYRPEIDGLRAIAVIMILLFHADIVWASGGYIGVDVFFVISGYLITNNIMHSLYSDEFSFSHFYIRRIRRLLPALLATVAVVTLFGFLLFSPIDLERLGQSITFTIVSLSNFFFFSEANYFNPSAEIKPLLHTWSLSLEEQFYVLWPSILFLMYRFKKPLYLMIFLVIIAIISLLLSHLYVYEYAEMVFFLLPFRMFEFAIGALCLFIKPHTNLKSIFVNVSFVIGLIMVVAPVVYFTKSTLFPSYNALIPCIGTAILICTGRSQLAQFLLSQKLLVKIGIVSYSTYLIHWPLMVFYKYWIFAEISDYEKIMLIMLSVILGSIMWKFIEMPLRLKKEDRLTTNNKSILLKLVLSAFVLILIATIFWTKKGLSSRLPSEFLMSKEEIKDNKNRFRKDFSKGYAAITKGTNDKFSVLIMGNSHSVDLLYALRQNGFNYHVKLKSIAHRCYNFGTAKTKKDEGYCNNQYKINMQRNNFTNIDAVFLHDNWPRFAPEDLYKKIKNIRDITSVPIYIFGPKMTYQKPIHQIVANHMRMASINKYGRNFMGKFRQSINLNLKNMIKGIDINDVYFIDVLKSQCTKSYQLCNIVSPENNKFLYFDAGHFTLQGAKELGQQLSQDYPEIFSLSRLINDK